MGKTRRKYRKKRKSRKRSRGGVGTAAQAAALSQVFKHLTQRDEHSGLPGEILKHQSFEDRDNVERKQRRMQARLDLDNRQHEINSQHHENQSVIRDVLASTTGLAEPRLIENIQHYARPRHPLQQQIRQRGQQNTDAIQAEIDHHDWVRTRNRELFRNAVRRAYPHLDPDNFPENVPLPPMRQLAEPHSRYRRLFQ